MTDRQAADQSVVGEVQLRHIPEFTAVMLANRGPYETLAESFSRLKRWSADVDVLPTGSTVCLFFDRPTPDPSAVRRYGVCLPTSKPEAARARAALLEANDGAATMGATHRAPSPSHLAPGDVLEVREVPRILAAVVYYRGAAGGSVHAYERLASWVRERPYLPAGAPREMHLAEPGQLGADIIEIEIQQPAIPKPR
ncbi:MAG: GyrI-like domain-containing protein [Actinobacteria bacterium]|nr:GyrI-like domain-containing protein [Actinomycetota bacterium]